MKQLNDSLNGKRSFWFCWNDIELIKVIPSRHLKTTTFTFMGLDMRYNSPKIPIGQVEFNYNDTKGKILNTEKKETYSFKETNEGNIKELERRNWYRKSSCSYLAFLGLVILSVLTLGLVFCCRKR